MTIDNGTIKLGTHTIDLRTMAPLKWKDVKALQKLGVDDEKLLAGDAEQADVFLRFVLKRAINEEPSQDDIDELTLVEVQRIVQHFSAEVQELDRPT